MNYKYILIFKIFTKLTQKPPKAIYFNFSQGIVVQKAQEDPGFTGSLYNATGKRLKGS